jgi:hypothetical protein
VIWIAWRFQRSVVCALAVLALIIIGAAIVLGVAEHHDLVQLMRPPCHGGEPKTPGRGDYCGELQARWASVNDYSSYIRAAGLIIAPLVGALLGLLALVSEIDNRTARLAWTQSISRTHWFGAKAGVGAALVMIILVPTAIILSWWNGTIGVKDLFQPQTFGVAGWDLVAYGLFTFALTLLLGAVIRRVGWTLAASVLLFLVVALAVPKLVRVHLATPTVAWSQPAVVAQGGFSGNSYSGEFPGNAWILVNGVAPRSTVGTPTWKVVDASLSRIDPCINGFATKTQNQYVKAEVACYKKFDVENVVVYIADNQFWTVQLREGLLYLVAGLVLTGGALTIVRRIEP